MTNRLTKRSGMTRFGMTILVGAVALTACDDSTTDPDLPDPPVPVEVEVVPAELTLTSVGATAELSATVLDADGIGIPGAAVTWSSSDEAVVTVSEDGEVEAAGEGAATVTAVSGDASGTAQVIVELTHATPATVDVTPEEVLFSAIGETEQLSATVLDEDGVEIPGAAVTWSSSDEAVATVSEDGEVEAIAEGAAEITAASGEAEATVGVTVAPEA